ncbi:MAG TPA: MarR family transcriptional regulator [Rhizomicrobium sp.]|jgi:DNA-binding MarR family transcriptional regulator|nr:MarR family transcriptional regulator [Rhizomicrobium sp.]
MGKPYYNADTFEARRSIGYLVKRVNALLLPKVEELFGDAELTFTHWIALKALRDGFGDTCADIARHMNHDAGATTRIVDQLEQRGLVERRRSTEDRRVVHLSLTADGKAMLRALTPRVVNYWNGILDDFSHAEVTQMIDLLSRLVDRFEEDAEKALEKPKVAR